MIYGCIIKSVKQSYLLGENGSYHRALKCQIGYINVSVETKYKANKVKCSAIRPKRSSQIIESFFQIQKFAKWHIKIL